MVKFLKNTEGRVPVVMILIVILVLCTTVLLYGYFESNGFFDVKCDEDERVMLEGVLLGFSRNESYRHYTNVRLQLLHEEKLYVFQRVDKDLLKSFIGLDVQIDTCYCENTTYIVENYYDMITIFMIGE